MNADADWYKQHLAAKKLRGECVFAVPGHSSSGDQHGQGRWVCVTHNCGLMLLQTATAIPEYVCKTKTPQWPRTS